MNWYRGQEIICIKDHSQGAVKKGQIYTIRNIHPAWCKCRMMLLDVGLTVDDTYDCVWCSQCLLMRDADTYGAAWLIDERLFAPLADISELQEILNEECQPAY